MAAARCTAFNLPDEKRCPDDATNATGLFCRFHAGQAQCLYRGYKIRNAKLDALNEHPPAYLAGAKTTLRNETFSDVNDEVALGELHGHLFKKYNLLDRVVRARQMHHSRFYSMNYDYGHKAYIDKLINERFVVLRALERLERRIAEVLYKQAKWFNWVRERQDDEEAAREKESEKMKQEAKLFRRHWKEAEARLLQKRRQEDQKRQEAFLDKAYQERLAQSSDDEELAWDPIEDAVEEEREDFVNMIRHLLWLSSAMDKPAFRR